MATTKDNIKTPVFIKGLELKRPAVLVDAQEYEGMKETLSILFEDSQILSKLKKAESELKQKTTKSLEKLKNELHLSR